MLTEMRMMQSSGFATVPLLHWEERSSTDIIAYLLGYRSPSSNGVSVVPGRLHGGLRRSYLLHCRPALYAAESVIAPVRVLLPVPEIALS